jgi:RHS repeat-associated protein
MEWQTVEVRKDGVTGPVEQYIWHPYYIDAIAVRYQDANANGDYNQTNEIQYYAHDANYNATGQVDAAGNLIERYTYTGYGHLIVMNASFTAIPSSMTNNPYTFTGRRLDSETGLYYYRNRFYHAQLGRFISRDPIEYAGGPNLYEYVASSPLTKTDPYGESLVDPRLEQWDQQFEEQKAWSDFWTPIEASCAIPDPSIIFSGSTWIGRLLAPVGSAARQAARRIFLRGRIRQACNSALLNASRLSRDEVATGLRAEAQFGVRLEESAHVGADFVDDLGRSYDALGTPSAAINWNETDFLNSIDRHLLKSNDFTIIDLTGFTQGQIDLVNGHLSTLSPEQLAKIKRIGF